MKNVILAISLIVSVVTTVRFFSMRSVLIEREKDYIGLVKVLEINTQQLKKKCKPTKSIKRLKEEKKLLARSLEAVKRDLWKQYAEQTKKESELFGKGGGSGKGKK